MPPAVPTGLHAPISNLVPVEATNPAELIALGDPGEGDAIELAADATEEPVVRPSTESMLESAFVGQPEVHVPNTEGLLDIGIASFGVPPQLEAVIGTDERIRITETTKLPWRLNASLVITAADNSQWIGTGWFISPRTLITAGHCVCIKGSGVPGRDGFVKKIQVIPGRDAANAPYGALTATEFWTVNGWFTQGLETFDYGAIVLPAAFSQKIGAFGYGVFTDDVLLSLTANIAGYPGDKPSGTLWYDKRAIGSVKPNKVFYAADTAGGQSGACVYVIRGRRRIGVAIHAYGGATANSGTRISAEVFANLENWKRS
ncbi:trypsin-like serine peptidase [Luteitalea sp.]|jgi:V8-like Glu-specific endopeptidase|uniref:trypsin-like serine peptidase n=1 Tax=Luteitalea sp. TaxID=2004800 RepID=UPI0037C82455